MSEEGLATYPPLRLTKVTALAWWAKANKGENGKREKGTVLSTPSGASLLVSSSPGVKLGSLTLMRHKMTLSHFSKDLIRPVSGGQLVIEYRVQSTDDRLQMTDYRWQITDERLLVRGERWEMSGERWAENWWENWDENRNKLYI